MSLNYSQGLSGVAVRHEQHIMFSYYRMDFVVTKMLVTYWVSWFKKRTLICEINQATSAKQHRQRSGTGDMLEIQWKAIKMTHNRGLELHEKHQSDAKVRVEAFCHYQAPSVKLQVCWHGIVSVDKHNCMGCLLRNSVCLRRAVTETFRILHLPAWIIVSHWVQSHIL